MRENQQKLNPAALAAAALSLLALFLLGPAGVSAQWTQPDASGNINNTNPGNVKVGGGTAAPTSVLHAKGNLSSQLTGTVAVTQNSGTVTGTGTAFTTELSVGDSVKIGTSIFTVSAISSATSLTLDTNYTGTTASGLSAFRDPGLFAVDNGAGVNKLTVDKSGKVGIGTATPTSRLSVTETLTTGSRGIGIIQYSGDTTPALLNLTKMRGVPGTPSPIVNGDTLGLISVNAYTGGYLATAGIHFIVNGTVSQPSAPTDIVFKAGNAGFGSERMRITSGGFVGIGNPAPSYTLDVAGLVRSSSGGFVFPDGTTQATALSFGSAAGKAVQGNTTLTVTAGAGMSGGGTSTLGAGGTLTLVNDDRGSAQNIFKNIGNAAGVTQFSASSNPDTLRFEGTGGTTVSFDANSKKVIINSASGSSGWTDAGTTMRLTNTAAKLGVGTTSPDKPLTVEGALAAPLGVLSVIRTTGSNNGYGLALDATGTGNNNLGFTIGGTPKASLTWHVGDHYLGFINNDYAVNYFSLRLNSDGSLGYNDSASGAERFRVTAAGNVGIGTSAPSAKLDVVQANATAVRALSGSASAHVNIMIGRTAAEGTLGVAAGVGQYTTDAAAGDVVLRTEDSAKRILIANGTGASTLAVSGGKLGIGKTNPTEALDVVGNIKATGSVSATYQDVAEWVPSTQRLAAGTVVVLDADKSNHVLASTSAYDTKVAGVISDSPGVILGVGGEDKLKVATTGRVKVKVDATRAPIRVGDLLVTGDVEGVAMRSEPVEIAGRKMHVPGTIIGKALEPLASGTGEILVLLSLQ